MTQELIVFVEAGPAKIGIVRERDANGATYIRVGIDGNLVYAGKDEFKRQVVDQLERGDRAFVLDLTRCRYIDSAGLGVIVSISRKIATAGGAFIVEGLCPDLRTLFALTKLDAFLTIREGKEEKHA